MTAGGMLRAYPYLFTNVITFAGLFLAGVFLPLRHRRLLLRLALLNACTCPNALFFEADYWTPARVWPWPLGIEDVLCTLNLGALGCMPALWFARRWIVVPDVPRVRVNRVLALGAFAEAVMLGTWWATSRSTLALIATQASGFAVLLWLRRDLWRLALVNGLGFLVLYGCLLSLFGRMWPTLASYWHDPAGWGRLVLGVPLVELVYAATFGLVWPLFAGYAFELRFLSSTEATPGQRRW